MGKYGRGVWTMMVVLFLVGGYCCRRCRCWSVMYMVLEVFCRFLLIVVLIVDLIVVLIVFVYNVDMRI